MSVLQNVENKIKLVTIVAVVAIIGCVAVSIGSVITASLMVKDANNHVYVIDGSVPIALTKAPDAEMTGIEARSLVEAFHTRFFDLTPDETYINYTVKRALYLIDNSGRQQYGLLKEQGFYDNLVSTNTSCTLYSDSIKFSTDSMSFTFYGRQRLERSNMIVYRLLITKGEVYRLPSRTDNNPWGMAIRKWKIVVNKDLSKEAKTNY